MTKRPNPKVYMAMAGGMLVVGIGLTYFAYSGLLAEQDVVAGLHKQARSESDVRTDLNAAQKKLSDCQALLTHLEQGVPDHAYVPTLLTELEKIGLENGIQVTGVKPVPKVAAPVKGGGSVGAPASEAAYEDLDIQVQGVGKYANAHKFISALNAFPKIVAARTVALAPRAAVGKEWSDVLDVTIDLRAYVFPEKSANTADTPANGAEGSVAGPTSGTIPAEGAVPVAGVPTRSAPVNGHPSATYGAVHTTRPPYAGPQPLRHGSPFLSQGQPVSPAAAGGQTR